MRQPIYMLLLICLISFWGCTNEEDLIFDKTSAERLDEAMAYYKTLFTSEPDGWVMEYFPNKDSEGVIFLMRFDKNGSCLIGTRNRYQKTYKTERSLFDMIGDNGPVLTFNSYNSLLHIFSEPKLPGQGDGEADGRGLEGDYEFIVLKADADTKETWLKGKKQGAYIRMRTLPDGTDWEQYMNQVDQMKSRLFSTENLFYLNYRQGDKQYKAYNANLGIFSMVEPGEDVAEGEPLPFIVIPEGIRVYENKADLAGTFYTPDEKNTRLTSTDNGDTDYFTGQDPITFFAGNSSYTWMADTTTFDAGVKNVLGQMRQKLLSKSIYNGQMKLSGIAFAAATFPAELTPDPVLQVRLVYNRTNYIIPIKMTLIPTSDGQLQIGFADPLDYSANTIGKTLEGLGFTEFKLLPALLAGTYRLSSGNGFLLKDLQLSGTTNISLTR